MISACRRCGLVYPKPCYRPCCLKCSAVLYAQGICKYCQTNERNGNGQYCKPCKAKLALEVPRRGERTGVYRSAEQRENVQETKYGRDS